MQLVWTIQFSSHFLDVYLIFYRQASTPIIHIVLVLAMDEDTNLIKILVNRFV